MSTGATTLKTKDRTSYIGTSEAAERLGVHPKRIYQLCREGRIEGAKLYLGRWIIPIPLRVLGSGSKKGGPTKIKYKKPA